MKVDILIPNFNGAQIVEKNLPFVLASHRGYEGKIIIVDDGSNLTDKRKLREFVASGKHKNVELIEHAKNKGFSSAINTGVRNSTSDFIVLLNSDVAPSEDFLKSPIAELSKNKLLFGVGCMDQSIEDGKTVLRGRGLGFWKGGMIGHRRGEVDQSDTFWISGGSCILRRDIFVHLGGMDTLYNPFYWEDIDLSYRAVKSGFQIIFDKNSVVKHFHGEGAIKTNFNKQKVTTAAYRNQFIFTWKNITSASFLTNHLLTLPIHLLRAVRRWDTAFVSGLFLALLKLPAIIKKRKKQKKYYMLSDVELLHHIS